MKKTALIIIICVVFALSGVTTFAGTSASAGEEPQTETTITENTDAGIEPESQTENPESEKSQEPTTDVDVTDNNQGPMSNETKEDASQKASTKATEKSDAAKSPQTTPKTDSVLKGSIYGDWYYDWYYDDYMFCDHFYKELTDTYSLNSKYHTKVYYCSNCFNDIYVKQAHKKKWYYRAYDADDGVWCYGCKDCGYNEYDAQLDYTVAYKKKKYVKVYLSDNVYQGDLLTVKIGKKTYKKKITKSEKNPMYKLKIKKPKKNKKIHVYVTHRGEKVYLGWEYVMTSWNPKKGMTKKQVRNYTAWGDPDETRKASGGYSYWYYDDGSYIVFKRGRVKKWYG